ncbi:hypothetical protein BS329_09160 [Amycolatopsis coloradensis]|uniref:Uncharacterized protein n=1 Tax=Amycolatopsis coloradensis TaxID=76021 RepID=A0A1R0KZG6_9PSEU|nr:hypothetical protein [Amycolatopsis coloradensis]OLZ54664.1 hypothetical protein BS329_09160 [Amycolatopsis coloradensis]
MSDPTLHGLVATRLVEATRVGAHEYVTDVLSKLAASGSAELPILVARELIDSCASVIVRHRMSTDDDVLYSFIVENERAESVDVDNLPPGPRAALRALVATLNGDESACDIQVALATRGTPEEAVTVLIHCLMWTLELKNFSPDRCPRLSCYSDGVRG